MITGIQRYLYIVIFATTVVKYAFKLSYHIICINDIQEIIDDFILLVQGLTHHISTIYIYIGNISLSICSKEIFFLIPIYNYSCIYDSRALYYLMYGYGLLHYLPFGRDVLDISGLSRWMDKFGASIVFFSRLQV